MRRYMRPSTVSMHSTRNMTAYAIDPGAELYLRGGVGERKEVYDQTRETCKMQTFLHGDQALLSISRNSLRFNLQKCNTP